MNKGDISNILRKLGLMHLTDDLRYYYFKIKNSKKNKDFLKNNPEIVLPPPYYVYEAFQLNYEEYYSKSIESAKWILDFYKKHKNVYPTRVLDWGCGPGRIIRHLPNIIGEKSEVYGTDYNKKSIEWCRNNLKEIDFNHNGIEAELPYDSDFFEYIFGISIFTHLSKKKHYEWVKELSRITKKGGLLFFTTHGNAFKSKLNKKELQNFNEGELLVRGNVKEGHRTYTAYHPEKFMRDLYTSNGLKIIEHIEQKSSNKKPQQDIWLLEKV